VAGDVKRILPEPKLKPEELYPAGMSGAMADLESTMEETLGDLYKEKLASQADAAAAAEKSKLTAAGSGAAGAFGAGGVGGGGAAGTGAIDMAHFYGKAAALGCAAIASLLCPAFLWMNFTANDPRVLWLFLAASCLSVGTYALIPPLSISGVPVTLTTPVAVASGETTAVM
ncbi:MAG: uncharacterized protein KVP18_001182, partial [Porospora cf. gigantea A]|uniref:uncharacterized protein n=1 Tax=Porospora cf. gigantea A TaxID=2853593 RepID=UPI00355A3C8A